MLVLEALCGLAGCTLEDAPAAWVQGTFTRNILTRLASYLWDATFIREVDGNAMLGKVQFSCGYILNIVTGELEKGRRELMNSKTTGYPFPAAEFQGVADKLADLGISLETVLRRCRDCEGPLVPHYPQSLVAELDRAFSLPAMEIMRLLHDSFTHRGATGEIDGGWQMALWRGPKCHIAAMCGNELENFIVDAGVFGSNGKGTFALCSGFWRLILVSEQK
jgi:hypothetical protein